MVVAVVSLEGEAARVKMWRIREIKMLITTSRHMPGIVLDIQHYAK